MTLRQANYYSHFLFGPFVVARGHQTTSVQYRTLNFWAHREESAMRRTMLHCGTPADCFARLRAHRHVSSADKLTLISNSEFGATHPLRAHHINNRVPRNSAKYSATGMMIKSHHKSIQPSLVAGTYLNHRVQS